jgi:hypothetical protein
MYTNTDLMKQEGDLLYNLKKYKDSLGRSAFNPRTGLDALENDICIRVEHSKNMNKKEKQSLMECIADAVNKHISKENEKPNGPLPVRLLYDNTTRTALIQEGKIPARTTCPVKSICTQFKQCIHLGKKHNVEFSCKQALVLVSSTMTFEEHVNFLLKFNICPVCETKHNTHDKAVHCQCASKEAYNFWQAKKE